MYKFKEFSKIQNLKKIHITVTQKLHGTNASLWIEPTPMDVINGKYQELIPFITADGEFLVRPAKRTSFIDLEHDNFGFAKFVAKNKDALARSLGTGVWFGEWCGPGINSGEGLTEKRLALFSVHLQEKMDEMKKANLWPDRVDLVPVLFQGPGAEGDLNVIMSDLKTNGSKYVPGFMRPEGMVVSISGTNAVFKAVFDSEETQWKKPHKSKEDKQKERVQLPNVDHLLQPIRLEKLLSKDEELQRNLPKSLSQIVKLYVADLESEDQLSKDEDVKAIEKKALGASVFGFIKSELKQKGLL